MDAAQKDLTKKSYRENARWLAKFQAQLAECEPGTPKYQQIQSIIESYQDELNETLLDTGMTHEEMMV